MHIALAFKQGACLDNQAWSEDLSIYPPFLVDLDPVGSPDCTPEFPADRNSAYGDFRFHLPFVTDNEACVGAQLSTNRTIDSSTVGEGKNTVKFDTFCQDAEDLIRIFFLELHCSPNLAAFLTNKPVDTGQIILVEKINANLPGLLRTASACDLDLGSQEQPQSIRGGKDVGIFGS